MYFGVNTSYKILMFIYENQVKSYFKNIIFYIGIILVGLAIYLSCSNFLKLDYVKDESELEAIYQRDSEDIIAGRVPTTFSEKLNGLYTFLGKVGTSEEELSEIQHHIEENSLDFREIYKYLEKEKGMDGISRDIEPKYGEKKGTMKEINGLLSQYLSKGIFSEKISNKFIDFLCLYLTMFTLLISVFLFGNELRKDTYELLHTKSLKSSNYILSKVLGEVTAIAIACIPILIVLTICAIGVSGNLNVEYRMNDLFFGFLIFCIPSVLYICSFSCLISLVCKTPLPAVPIIFLQIIYSNTGGTASDGSFRFITRPLSLLVRFPGAFFETEIRKEMYYNSILLLVVSLIILIASIQLWKRRTTI